MSRPLAADDFAAIRARLEELRRERERSPQQPDLKGADISQRLLPLSDGCPSRTGQRAVWGPSEAVAAAEVLSGSEDSAQNLASGGQMVLGPPRGVTHWARRHP